VPSSRAPWHTPLTHARATRPHFLFPCALCVASFLLPPHARAQSLFDKAAPYAFSLRHPPDSFVVAPDEALNWGPFVHVRNRRRGGLARAFHA
jgi:hypothetical protein